MFTIEMLPAREGDALWVEYGDPAAPRRFLVDCGYQETYREVSRRMKEDPRLTFELFVVTHIDDDHITGAVPFIADARVTRERIRDVWFNGRAQTRGLLGAAKGEYFSRLLVRKGFAWNAAFGGAAVAVPDSGELPTRELEGGMRLTLLSPRRDELVDLDEKWTASLDKLLRGREPDEVFDELPESLQPTGMLGDSLETLARRGFRPDVSATNGSSIAFLARYADPFDGGREKSALFAGDAFAPVLTASLARLRGESGERVRLDALKVAHHGSRHNTDAALLDSLACRRFLISTDGSKKQAHPDPECIARVLKSPRSGTLELDFNYRSAVNRQWDARQREYGYTARYPDPGTQGLRVEL